MSRVAERGPQELITDKAWEELEEVMKEGRIATYAQAHAFFLRDLGIEYANPDTAWGSFFRQGEAQDRPHLPGMRKPTRKSRRPSKKLPR